MNPELEGQVQGDPAPELLDGRVWVDGCFDFFHHGTSSRHTRRNHSRHPSQAPPLTPPGHAGAIVQARQLGDELYAGVHSDEAILANKGPTVMNLAERSVSLLPIPLEQLP